MKRAHIVLSSWAGMFGYPVDVLKETPKRYRIRTRVKTPLPKVGWVAKGTVKLVEKDVVWFAWEGGQ